MRQRMRCVVKHCKILLICFWWFQWASPRCGADYVRASWMPPGCELAISCLHSEVLWTTSLWFADLVWVPHYVLSDVSKEQNGTFLNFSSENFTEKLEANCFLSVLYCFSEASFGAWWLLHVGEAFRQKASVFSCERGKLSRTFFFQTSLSKIERSKTTMTMKTTTTTQEWRTSQSTLPEEPDDTRHLSRRPLPWSEIKCTDSTCGGFLHLFVLIQSLGSRTHTRQNSAWSLCHPTGWPVAHPHASLYCSSAFSHSHNSAGHLVGVKVGSQTDI